MMLGGFDPSPVFAFGLVAFGFLGMGPVTIAVDCYGPVTDNAQSVFELSLIETIPNIKDEIKKDFGFDARFEKAKHFLEENDGAGNTFKATAKPVLIGTAVVGATTMIFSIIVALTQRPRRTNIEQAVDPPPAVPPRPHHRRRGHLLVHRRLHAGGHRPAPTARSSSSRRTSSSTASRRRRSRTRKKVVEICTQYAQKGMFNIFLAIFFSHARLRLLEPFFFIGYLISIALFGLFQAIFMANAGGAWDNAKKIVEVELKEKGTPLHAAVRRRRHRRRSLQGHVVGRAEPGHQVHDALRPPRRRARDHAATPGAEPRPRRRLLRALAGLRLPLVLRHAHQERRPGRRRVGRQGRDRHEVTRSSRLHPPRRIPDFLKQMASPRHCREAMSRALALAVVLLTAAHALAQRVGDDRQKRLHATRTSHPPEHRRPPRRRRLEARPRRRRASRRTSPTKGTRRRSAPTSTSPMTTARSTSACAPGTRIPRASSSGSRVAIATPTPTRSRSRSARRTTASPPITSSINVSGVLQDGVRFNDTDGSWDWDGLWLGAAHRDANGWSAELLIPLKTLRYEGGRSEFGFQVRRTIQRRQEVDEWAYKPRAATGEVSYYGVLDSLAGLHAARLFQIVPYLAGGVYLRYNQDPGVLNGTQLYGNIGADLKVGLTPALTLDATINPDFGQVEADQVVLNLSTFEVFFPEKRPFFLEGVDIFQTQLNLFYSRRIGHAPPLPDSNNYTGLEPQVPGRIYAAAKLTGLVAPRLTVGVLDAVTAESIDGGGALRHARSPGAPLDRAALQLRRPAPQARHPLALVRRPHGHRGQPLRAARHRSARRRRLLPRRRRAPPRRAAARTTATPPPSTSTCAPTTATGARSARSRSPRSPAARRASSPTVPRSAPAPAASASRSTAASSTASGPGSSSTAAGRPASTTTTSASTRSPTCTTSTRPCTTAS